jgi:WD40 repeat protein
MPSCLLLLSGSSGLAVRVEAVSVADGPAELELSRLTVGRVSVNGELAGVLALSAKQGGTAALQLLFREFGHNFPIARLDVRTGALSASVTGRSSELLFGLEVFLNVARRDRLIGLQGPAFAATGTLDVEGNVGSVEGVPAKIAAAIDSNLPAGSFVFYPRANDAEVTPDLRQHCVARGLILKPVDQLEEALIALGVTINGRWVGTPYRSLEAFERQHSRIFFGRQGEIRRLVKQLETRAAAGRPGALVIGGSGSGKSSFCMAGVLPALERLSPSLEHAVWRPGSVSPASLGERITESDIARSVLTNWQLRDTKNGAGFSLAASLPNAGSLAELAISLPEDWLASRRHVWIIDQFEELFTLGFSNEAQIAFARFLSDLQARGIWVIATLRNEFFNRYQDLHDGDIAVLTEVFGTKVFRTNDGEFKLARMGRDALRQVIALPAELAGLKFETRSSDNVRLDDVILADAMATTDVLPLLEFTLQLLYDGLKRTEPPGDDTTEQPRLLTFAAYEALGGIKGAIGKIVEPTFAALDAETQKALLMLLDALAVPAAEGQRETARPAAIKQWPPDGPERNLINALIGIRVLVSDDAGHPGAGAQVRVAHEALFTHWPDAAVILKESQQTRLVIEDFRQRAEAWDKDGQPSGGLLAAPKDIENARAVLPRTSNSPARTSINRFIQESISADEQRLAADVATTQRQLRNRNWVIVAAITAIVILAALAIWAINQRNEAFFQRSRAIAQVAEQTIENGDAIKGILIALTQVGPDEKASGDIENALLKGLLSNREEAVLNGHRNNVLSAVFSPDGERIVTASLDNTARVWTLMGGSLSSITLRGHTDAVIKAVFSPDGRRIVTASRDNTARVWTLADGRWSSVVLEGHSAPVFSAVFSQDGQRIVTASLDSTARVWTLANGRWSSVALIGHGHAVASARFSPDAQSIVTASADNTARVWTLADGRWLSTTLEGHSNTVVSAEFSSDGRRIVTASLDDTARVWTLANGLWTSVALKGHGYHVLSAAFSPDGEHIVTASQDTTARVWTWTGSRWSSITLEGHGAAAVTSAVFSPDGQRIVTGSLDETARVWTLADGIWSSVVLKGHSAAVNSAVFSPDGKRIITASGDHTARTWTVAGGRWSSVELEAHRGSVTSAVFSPDGKRIVTASEDKTARVWTLAGGRSSSIVLEGHTAPVTSAVFSPNGQRIVTASKDSTARVWTLADGRWSSTTLEGHSSTVISAILSSDGRHIVTASLDNTVRVWTLIGRRWSSLVLKGLSSNIVSVDISPDGQRIVTACWDEAARVWTLAGGRWSSVALVGHSSIVESAVFSPDGQHIVTASGDGTARLWTLASGRWSSVALNGHSNVVSSALFSPDGQRIVTASLDQTARVWTLADGSWSSVVLKGHDGAVTSAAFSADGQRIVTASLDNTARIWTLANGRWSSVALEAHRESVTSAAFSPDGQRIVTASEDHTARVWSLPFGQALVKLARQSLTRCLSNGDLEGLGLSDNLKSHSTGLRQPPCN